MKRFAATLLLAMAACAWGQAPGVAKADPRTEQRLKELAEELRCLVCQNQTIADSSAPLAVDLRQQIRGQIAQGASDDQIRAYMVERYGDFVLYRPPFKASTALLWAGPFALVALGAVIFFRVVRRPRAARAPDAEPSSERSRVAELLASEDDQRPATAEISTRALRGSRDTSTTERAGIRPPLK